MLLAGAVKVEDSGGRSPAGRDGGVDGRAGQEGECSPRGTANCGSEQRHRSNTAALVAGPGPSEAPQLLIGETFSLAGEAGGAQPSKRASLEKPGRDAGRAFKCGECGKRFRAKAALRKHLAGHAKTKRHACEECGKEFPFPKDLIRHERIHTGEKPYKCDVCGKKFNRLSILQTHKRIHTGEKPYECDVCDKKFNHEANFTRHKRVHTAEKPFECDVCGKKFADRSVLRRHKSVHNG